MGVQRGVHLPEQTDHEEWERVPLLRGRFALPGEPHLFGIEKLLLLWNGHLGRWVLRSLLNVDIENLSEIRLPESFQSTMFIKAKSGLARVGSP